MKIQFDHQVFSLQNYGGVSRYFYELCKELNKINDTETYIPLVLSNNHYISDMSITNHTEFMPNKNFRGKTRLKNTINRLNTQLRFNKFEYNVFHPTYYDPYFLNKIGDKPLVITIYDMIHEKFSEMFPSQEYSAKNKKILAHKASKIIAISESTKQDIIEILGIDENKIKVIYLGNSMSLSLSKSNIDLPNKYLLFVGYRGEYKNFNRFIDSAAHLLNDDCDLNVICVGGGEFSPSELGKFEKKDISKQLLQFDLDDDSLAYFYNNALAFVFPSLYEGFGMPVLEAFACECPLICSNTSSLPEVAGNAAEYFDPYDVSDMQAVITKVLNDSHLRSELVLKGKNRLPLFSWEATAKKTIELYKSIL